MTQKTTYAELSEIRDHLRHLRRREAELLVLLRTTEVEQTEAKTTPRPGWPVRRLTKPRVAEPRVA
jgi:hypothetical protein